MSYKSLQQEDSPQSFERIIQESFLGNEREQRKLENEYRRDEKSKEKKIALEKKILSIQLKEISAEQRLTKSRYFNLVKHSKSKKDMNSNEERKTNKDRHK